MMRDGERRRFGTRRARFISVAVVLLLAACGRAGASDPPWGLDSVTQPSDQASVDRVLAAMPDAVAGMKRAAPIDLRLVSYGQGNTLTVRVLQLGESATGEGLPTTAGGFLQGLVDPAGEVEVEAQHLDASSDLVYVVCIVTESFAGGGSQHEARRYAIAWGAPDSEWLFTAVADSPENRVALVEAFVNAARSIG
jgi:hypothetical protein